MLTYWDAMAGVAKGECILAQGHWDAVAGSKAPGQQPRVLPPAKEECIWLKDTGMPWLGCPAARAPTVLVIGAVAVPRWLKVCGLVSCVGWSQLWLGVKTTGRCQIHSLCVCVSVTSVQARER